MKMDTYAPSLLKEEILHVRLTGMRRLRFQLWLSVQLIRLAVWVGGWGGVEFIDETQDA